MSASCRSWTAWRASFKRRRRFGVARLARMADTVATARAIPTGEGGATMTVVLTRMAVLAAGFLALQACTMPHSQYAPSADYQTPASREAATPQYPVRTDSAPAPAVSADPHDPVAHPSTGVTSGALPPAAAPSSGPTSFNGPFKLFNAVTPAFFVSVSDELYQARFHRGVRARREVLVSSRGRLESAPETTNERVKIRRGDTLKSIAERYGTTVAAIMKANRMRRATDISVGQPIRIPTVTMAGSSRATQSSTRGTMVAETKATPKTYRAQRGDTIYAIGRKFGVAPKVIEELNGFAPTTHLRTGEVVRLPGAPEEEGTEAPQRVATRVRPHTVIESPTAPIIIPPARIEPPVRTAEIPSRNGEPDHPVPYNSLPGHITAPPQRSYYPAPVAPVVTEPQAPMGPPDAQVVLAGRGRFLWPVRGTLISAFGPKAGGQRSDGLDIAAPLGSPVRAAATGNVVYAGDLVPGLGNLVLIKHEDGWITAYAHLSRTEVKIKDHVSQGDEIGQVGQTGGAVQPEVYFEIRYAPTPRDKAKPVDPQLLLSSQ